MAMRGLLFFVAHLFSAAFANRNAFLFRLCVVDSSGERKVCILDLGPITTATAERDGMMEDWNVGRREGKMEDWNDGSL
jgi:hypothetical protein